MKLFYLTMVRLMVIGTILIIILTRFATLGTPIINKYEVFSEYDGKEKLFLVKGKGEEKSG